MIPNQMIADHQYPARTPLLRACNDDHTFEEFEDESEFNDDHAFEEFKDESEFNDDHTFEEFKVENEFNQVQKLGLIFIYYKSEVADRSGQKIGTVLHLLQVQGLRPIGSRNLFDWSSTIRGLRPIGFRNWDWCSSTTNPRVQVADQVRKLGLIFTYYKSEVSGRSGLEIWD